MEIQEVSDILGLCYFLKAPEHVFITQEEVHSHVDGQIIQYRGLQPKIRGDSIFLSVRADETSPIHEAVHASLGLGEIGTEIISRVIIRKNSLLKNFPRLTSTLSKKLVYQQVQESQDYPRAHLPQYAGRVQHFVLKQTE
jgi:hypothetical protein